MTSVLLTGATGFIGSHLADALVQRGHGVHLYVRRRTEHLRVLEKREATVIVGNGADDRTTLGRALGGVDTVIHCAASVRAVNREAFYQANVRFTENILRLINRDQTFFFISSQAAAGPSRPGRPVDETVEPLPVTEYGRTKLLAEQAVDQWGQECGGHYLILRPSSVYGPRERDFYWLFKGISRGLAVIPGNGRQRLSLIHVADLVRAVLAALHSDRRDETYFVTGDESGSWLDLVRLIQAALSQKRVLEWRCPAALALPAAWVADAVSRVMERPGLLCRDKVMEMKQPAWLCSSTKFKADVDWSPDIPLETGIRHTAEWYRKAGWL